MIGTLRSPFFIRDTDMRPLSEIEEELARTNPEALKRSREAMEFLMLHGKALLNNPHLQDPGGALCGKVRNDRLV